MMDNQLLEIKDLRLGFRVYGGTSKVLDGVNLYIHRGQSIGLVGETGAGKTTILKTIMGILPRQARVQGGEVLAEGKDLLETSPAGMQAFRRQKASMIFQSPTAALNPVFTVGDQLRSVIRYSRRDSNRSNMQKIAIKALEDVSLADPERLLRSYPAQLSGGMRQRICIAMALASQPKLLLADEPGTSLDVTIKDQILRLIGRLVESEDLALMLVTHSLGVVREVTERVYVIYAGTVVEEGPTKELFANPVHPYTRLLMQCVPKLSGGIMSKGILGSLPDYLHPSAGCRFSPRCSFATERCRRERPPLVEVEPGHRAACFEQGGASSGETE